MSRINNKKSVVQEEDAPNLPKSIGHITTSVEDIGRVKHILERHSVILIKCKSDDNWWTLILPTDSQTVLQDRNDKYSLHTVYLPDGYKFEYLPPIFSYYGTRGSQKYARLPQIVVE